MKLAVLFSGGKDSSFVAWLAKKEGYDLSCLVSVISENKESFMFHTPSISGVKIQAEAMNLPLVLRETKGKREVELEDLKIAILEAKERFGIEGVVTGAVESVYQASRVQKICNDLNLECFNPLWQKNQIELLKDMVSAKFRIIIVGVAAYPLDERFLGRVIDDNFIKDIIKLKRKFDINPAGEGGEFESFVLDGPLFERGFRVSGFKDFGDGNSWRRELKLENE